MDDDLETYECNQLALDGTDEPMHDCGTCAHYYTCVYYYADEDEPCSRCTLMGGDVDLWEPYGDASDTDGEGGGVDA